MSGIPDFPLGETIDFKFTTRQFSDGVPTNSASLDVAVYEDDSTAEITGADTITTNFDGRPGLVNVRIVATGGNGFQAGSSYAIVIIAGTVGGTALTGEVVAQFTIERGAALRPTTAGRTLDIAATGEVALDFGSTIGTLDAAQFGADFLTSAKIADNAFLAVNFGADFLTSAKIANDAFLAVNFAAGSLDGKGDWNIGKTGYALTTADWNVGKTGYSIATNGIGAGAIAAAELTNIEDEIWDALKSAHTTPNSFGDFLDIEVSGRQPSGAVDLNADQSGVTIGTLNALAANVITATSINAAALDGKGDWNIGKTGYTLSQAFPANFSSLSISAGGLVDILQTAADKVFGSSGAALAELSQAQPAATPRPDQAIMLNYMALRNKLDVDTAGNLKEIHNDAGTQIATKATSDDGTLYSEAKMIAGT